MTYMTASEKLEKATRIINESKVFGATASRKLAEAKEAGAKATLLLAEARALLAEVHTVITLEAEK
jgi:hypothetical protein